MHLEKLPVSQLKPAPYNPRIKLKPGDPAWEKLERSLREFELVQPIVWNRVTGHVVSGHQRLEVLKHHGHAEVDCVVVELPLEREQALNVTLNNASVGSDWESEKLVDLLTELQGLPDFDATLTGFDERQLNDLILAPAAGFEPQPEEQLTHIRATLEIPEEDWDTVQMQFDELLADHPEVRLHIQFPD